VFGVQAARGVNEEVIRLARLRGGDCVVRHGRSVRAIRAGDDFDLKACAPEFELLDGGGAKGVARSEQRGFFCDWMRCASLAEVVVLPVPFTPTMETTVGPLGALSKSGFVRRQILFDFRTRDGEHIVRVPIRSPADGGDDCCVKPRRVAAD